MKVSIPYLFVLTFFLACQSNQSNQNNPNEAEAETSNPVAQPAPSSTFSKTLEMKGLKFEVTAAIAEGGTLLTVQSTGLSGGDGPVQNDFSGEVLDAYIADMDNDTWPEVLVVYRMDGPSKQCHVIPYTVVNGVRLVEMYFPSVLNDTYYSNGYKGEDQISLVDKYLIQMFPVYKHGDKNGQPTGGSRQLQYELQVKPDGKKEFQVVSVTDQAG